MEIIKKMLTSFKHSLRRLILQRERSLTPVQYRTKKDAFNERLSIKKGEWFFVSPYGIGDLCIILSLLPEFRKMHKAKKIAIGITTENHKDLFSVYPRSADRYEILDRKELIFCKSNPFAPGNPVIIHPEHIYPSSMQSLIGYKKFTLMDVYKVLLNLPISCTTISPASSDKGTATRALQRFRDYGLVNRNTILLAPDAFSYRKPVISKSFWERLVKGLRNLGYTTAMMTRNQELAALEGIIRVDFPLKEAIPFVEYCGGFIGNRSGFCDLIASVSAISIILFSNEKWHSGSLMEGSSLKRMGVAGENTFELEVDSSDAEGMIPHILSLVKQQNHE